VKQDKGVITYENNTLNQTSFGSFYSIIEIVLHTKGWNIRIASHTATVAEMEGIFGFLGGGLGAKWRTLKQFLFHNLALY
jgi:hypothetical protein